MKKRPYIHPSQGEDARAYFEQMLADDNRCFPRARRLGVTAFALVIATAESAHYNAPLATVFLLGATACAVKSMESIFLTDEIYHEKRAYLEEAQKHYSTCQAPAPEWLNELLSCNIANTVETAHNANRIEV